MAIGQAAGWTLAATMTLGTTFCCQNGNRATSIEECVMCDDFSGGPSGNPGTDIDCAACCAAFVDRFDNPNAFDRCKSRYCSRGDLLLTGIPASP